MKPCPHCGHKAALMKLPNTRPFVECQGRPAFATDGFACGARTGYYSTEAEAIAAWQARTPSSATPEVSELVERLRQFEGSDALGNGDFNVCDEAATALETLEARVKVLEEALKLAATRLDQTSSGGAGRLTRKQWAKEAFAALHKQLSGENQCP